MIKPLRRLIATIDYPNSIKVRLPRPLMRKPEKNVTTTWKMPRLSTDVSA